jgi:hypothetical protein
LDIHAWKNRFFKNRSLAVARPTAFRGVQVFSTANEKRFQAENIRVTKHSSSIPRKFLIQII